jgi:hypothetical protein
VLDEESFQFDDDQNWQKEKRKNKTAENHTHCTNSRVEMDGWMDGTEKERGSAVTIFSINIKRNQTNQQFAAVSP